MLRSPELISRGSFCVARQDLSFEAAATLNFMPESIGSVVFWPGEFMSSQRASCKAYKCRSDHLAHFCMSSRVLSTRFDLVGTQSRTDYLLYPRVMSFQLLFALAPVPKNGVQAFNLDKLQAPPETCVTYSSNSCRRSQRVKLDVALQNRL